MSAEAIRIMVLAIFNHSEIYDEFYKLNMLYLDALKSARPHIYENMRFYYVIADPECSSVQIDESTRMITVNGTESLCPGILDKTIKSLRHVNDLRHDDSGFKYDYILRTNATTFINIELLYTEILELHSWNYTPQRKYKYVAMGHICACKHPGINSYGLTEEAMQVYIEEKFLMGTCIIINVAIASEIVRHAKTRINYKVIDDVELGKFIWSLSTTPEDLYVKDISDRTQSYYVDTPTNPYIFCNNRYKANRYSDLKCFRSVSEMHINKLK